MNEASTTEQASEGVQRAQRCGACGGLNPPDARWCGQCLARFEDALSPPPPTPSPPPPTPSAPPSSPPLPTEAPSPAPAPQAPGGTARPTRPVPSNGHAVDAAFRVTEEGISWTCSVCETVNDLDSSICEVCSAPFARTVLPEEERPERDPNMTALISLFLPGAGHAYLGMWGQAIARAVVSLWVWMVVFVAALQKGAASSNLVMAVFGVVAFGLWGVGAHDAYREARNEHPLVILKGKVFFYMVLGLLLLLVALLMSAMVKAQGS